MAAAGDGRMSLEEREFCASVGRRIAAWNKHHFPASLRTVSYSAATRTMTYAFEVSDDEAARPQGNLYGGVMASLTDGLTALVLNELTGARSITTDLSVSYFRPAASQSTVTAEVTVPMQGRTLLHAEIAFKDAQGKVRAFFTYILGFLGTGTHPATAAAQPRQGAFVPGRRGGLTPPPIFVQSTPS